ncbi:MAG: hypothetical protein JXA60_01715 [Candidatus Coatesbacteria bacterium]|nr:hypothetical protein [Candidatus Coatesbacteria bacterium]
MKERSSINILQKNLYLTTVELERFLKTGKNLSEEEKLQLLIYIKQTDSTTQIPRAVLKRIIYRLEQINEKDFDDNLNAILSFYLLKLADSEFMCLNLKNSYFFYIRAMELTGYKPEISDFTEERDLEKDLQREAFYRFVSMHDFPDALLRRLKELIEKTNNVYQTSIGYANILLVDSGVEGASFCLPLKIISGEDSYHPDCFLFDNILHSDKPEMIRFTERAESIAKKTLSENNYNFRNDDFDSRKYRITMRDVLPSIHGNSLGFGLTTSFISYLSQFGENEFILRNSMDIAGSAALNEDGSFSSVADYYDKIVAAIENGITNIYFPSIARKEEDEIFKKLNTEFPNLADKISIYYIDGVWQLISDENIFERSARRYKKRNKIKSVISQYALGVLIGLSAYLAFIYSKQLITWNERIDNSFYNENILSTTLRDGSLYRLEILSDNLNIKKFMTIPENWSRKPSILFIENNKIRIWNIKEHSLSDYDLKPGKYPFIIDCDLQTSDNRSYFLINSRNEDINTISCYSVALSNPFCVESSYKIISYRYLKSNFDQNIYDRLVMLQIKRRDRKDALDELIITSIQIPPMTNTTQILYLDNLKWSDQDFFKFLYLNGRLVIYLDLKDYNNLDDFIIETGLMPYDRNCLPEIIHASVLHKNKPLMSFEVNLTPPTDRYRKTFPENLKKMSVSIDIRGFKFQKSVLITRNAFYD